eukprot:3066290-Prymnesium_polylepis.1
MDLCSSRAVYSSRRLRAMNDQCANQPSGGARVVHRRPLQELGEWRTSFSTRNLSLRFESLRSTALAQEHHELAGTVTHRALEHAHVIQTSTRSASLYFASARNHTIDMKRHMCL